MINEISFSEVYEIILHMDKKISQKIPDKFINFIIKVIPFSKKQPELLKEHAGY